MEFGQFCPIAKASEIIGEKWSLLIIREVLMGSSRFSELQRGLSLISPALLTKRLNTLADYGLLLKRPLQGQRGNEYLPTEACRELLPILLAMGEWGLRWAKQYLNESDYDVELLMLYLQRSIKTNSLPGGQTVVRFQFQDLSDAPNWWIVVTDDEVDVCTTDPGRDVDVYFTTSVKAMTELWLGGKTYKAAVREKEMTIVGPRALTRDIPAWLNYSVFSDLPSAENI